MTVKNLSKGRFLEFLRCPLTAWRLRHGEIDAIAADDYGSQFRADQGHIVGDLAVRWFDAFLVANGKPRGINIDAQLTKMGIDRQTPNWLSTAIALTQRALQDPNTWAIYEGTFHTGVFTTRADILAKTKQGTWNMIEVKSSMEKREGSYVQDMAYTTGVLLACGVSLHKIGLMRIDENYQLEEDSWLAQPKKLLNLMDISWKWQEQVLQTLQGWNTPQFNGLNTWQIADWVTGNSKAPPANWNPICKKCESCRQVYARGNKCHPVLDLPHIGNMENLFQELTNLSIFCLEDVPSGFFNTAKTHERAAAMIVESIKKKQIFVGQGLKQELHSSFVGSVADMLKQNGPIVWPVLYLDFEFLQTAVPLYQGLHPYEAVPFQYSLHCANFGSYKDGIFIPNLSTLQHREHLTDPATDGRVLLAKKFIQDIEEMGIANSTIMVYNKSAEQTCIEQLACLVENTEPEVANRLRNLYHRMVDLYAIISRPNLYHPDFHGEFKLKTVIKTFIPDLYAKLDIKSGDAALAAYGELAYAYRCPELSLWEATPDEKQEILENLRKYCYLDTYSLAALHYNLAMLAIDCPTCFNEESIATYRGVFRACPSCLDMISPHDRGHGLRCRGYKARTHPWKVAG